MLISMAQRAYPYPGYNNEAKKYAVVKDEGVAKRLQMIAQAMNRLEAEAFLLLNDHAEKLTREEAFERAIEEVPMPELTPEEMAAATAEVEAQMKRLQEESEAREKAEREACCEAHGRSTDATGGTQR